MTYKFMGEHDKSPADRISEIVGFLLTTVGVLCLLSLISWSRQDPSLNNETNIAPHNWLGIPGAYVSDILLQTLGLGSVAMLLVPSQWGISLAHQVRPTWMSLVRFLVWPFAACLWAGFFGTLPLLAIWALAPGLGFGGVLGDALSTISLQLFAPIFGSGASYVLGGIMYLSAAVTLTLFCIGKDMRWLRPWSHVVALASPEPLNETRGGNLGSFERRGSHGDAGAASKWLNMPSIIVVTALVAGIYFLSVFANTMGTSSNSCDGADVILALKGIIVGQTGQSQADGGTISSSELLRVKNIVDEGRENARHHCSATVDLSDAVRALAAKGQSSFDAQIYQVTQALLEGAGTRLDSTSVRYDIVTVKDENSNATMFVELQHIDGAIVTYWQALFADLNHTNQSSHVSPLGGGESGVKPPKKKFDPKNIASLLNKPPYSATQPDEAKDTKEKADAAETDNPDLPMTGSEFDVIRQRVSQCWNVSDLAGTPDANKLYARVTFSLNLDGSLAGRPVIEESGGGSISRLFAERTVQAILKCAPYDFLPAEKYNTWRDMDMKFSFNGASPP